MKPKRNINAYLKKVFKKINDRRIVDAINIRNIHNVYIFSVFIAVFDSLSLLVYLLFKPHDYDYYQSLINVGLCIIACILIIYLSKSIINKYHREGTISNTQVNCLVMLFYVAMSVWSIFVDVRHYAMGDQILTFYIVQFCFACFVVMPLRSGSLLIALSFITLLMHTYMIDNGVHIQAPNVLIFMIIAIFGNVLQHMIMIENEQKQLEILELNQMLKELALIDNLTRLKNRNALRNDLKKHLNQTVYVMMSDIDHFKHYNDTYGHDPGDEVLETVARKMMDVFGHEYSYRYGGDEFLVVLPEEDCDNFESRMMNWQKDVEDAKIGGIGQHVSCSCGYVKAYLGEATDLRASIKAADKALYKAKKKHN